MKRSGSHQNGGDIYQENSGSGPEERDIKPLPSKMRNQSCVAKSKFFQLTSKDRVRLTNLNNKNYKSNPLREGKNVCPVQDIASKVVLPMDQPVIGDIIHGGPNWKLQGLLCYNLGTGSNFHMHLQMSPEGHKENVSVELSFNECPEHEMSLEMVSWIQGYLVTLKLLAKDKRTLLATGSKMWEIIDEGSKSSGLNGVIDNFCSIAVVKSADELHTFRITKATGGNPTSSGGEFDTIQMEVDVQILFKFPPDRINKLQHFACYQSFQPDNIFRRMEILNENETFKAFDRSTSFPCKQMCTSSGNPSRYGQLVVLRVGQELEELYVYRRDLTGRSKKLDQFLSEQSVLDFPNVVPRVMVLFLDLLDEDRKGMSFSNETVPASFKNPDVPTTCEALKLLKDYKMSVHTGVIEGLLSNITHNFLSAVEIYSRGHEFGIKELMDSGLRYFREHKEEMHQDPSKKLMEKIEPQILVSIFSCLL